MTVRSVVIEDTETSYTCRAWNSVGEAFSSAMIILPASAPAPAPEPEPEPAPAPEPAQAPEPEPG